MSKPTRYFLDQDNDCHWFLVPESKRDEWDEWCSPDSEDERAREAPEWVKAMNGGPRRVTFLDPKFVT